MHFSFFKSEQKERAPEATHVARGPAVTYPVGWRPGAGFGPGVPDAGSVGARAWEWCQAGGPPGRSSCDGKFTPTGQIDGGCRFKTFPVMGEHDGHRTKGCHTQTWIRRSRGHSHHARAKRNQPEGAA